MNWRELTDTDLIGCLNAVEREAYTSVSISKGDDPASSLLENVAHEVRGRIAVQAAKESKEMPAGAVLPPEVIGHALAIVRHRLLAWADIQASPERVKEYETAVTFMQDLGKGNVRVTLDGETSPVEEQYRPRPRLNTNAARVLQGG